MSRIISMVLTLVFVSSSAWASSPDTAGMKRVFDKMQKALESKSEKLFKAQWHAVGYRENLVGGSGLAGYKVFKQGSRKGWYLKPDMSKLRSIPGQRGAPWIIPSKIWSPKKKRAVDAIFAMLIYHKKKWVMLGGGEKLKEVEALGQRYVSKKPLPPKKK